MTQPPTLQQADRLALQRTVLAAERTLLSWVRTALSMIGFGFTIYKFFQYLHETGHLPRPHAPRDLGLTLIALGTLTLLSAAYQHQRTLQSLGEARAARLPIALALLLALLGVLMFLSIYFDTGPFF